MPTTCIREASTRNYCSKSASILEFAEFENEKKAMQLFWLAVFPTTFLSRTRGNMIDLVWAHFGGWHAPAQIGTWDSDHSKNESWTLLCHLFYPAISMPFSFRSIEVMMKLNTFSIVYARTCKVTETVFLCSSHLRSPQQIFLHSLFSFLYQSFCFYVFLHRT